MNTTVLRVDGLDVEYQTDHGVLPAVQGVSFAIDGGEVVALVGESGSGKSTTAHSILRLAATNARITAGQAWFDEVDLLALPERRLRRYRGGQIGFVPQDPSVSLNPVKKVGEQIAEALRLHLGLNRSQAQDRAVALLDQVGLDNAGRRAVQYPHELSGGMRQRALIAIAISCRPRLVVADEPTSSLDVTVQRHILDRLEELVDQTRAALLLITHDLGVASDRADRIAVMHHGRIVETGPASEILRAPADPYSRRLIAAAPSLTAHRLRAGIGAAPERLPSAGAGARGGVGVHVRAGSMQDLEAAPCLDALRDPPLVQALNLRREFIDRGGQGLTIAVDNVSFALRRGRTLALVGESGSGKTTTARIVARLETADSGQVVFDGIDVTSLNGSDLRRYRRQVQLVRQDPYTSLDPRYSVRQTLDEALRAAGRHDRAERQRRLAELTDDVALARTTLSRRPRELSGGQRQRVAIARALAMDARLVLLDEPVSALDVSVQSEILRLLVELQHQHSLTYLMISHDLAVVRLVADEVAVMRRGSIVEHGETEPLLSGPTHEYTHELIESIPGSRQRSSRYRDHENDRPLELGNGSR
ncbi:MAG: ABC transporter ATP-binding protein, partial [Bifidobacteriaceae bacterium]|nr:ABC transporter ATP-binding protein [Bifidobacteriaceae bacterium]